MGFFYEYIAIAKELKYDVESTQKIYDTAKMIRKLDENYNFDERVYFYFANHALFDQARVAELEDVGFKIMTVLDE
jgi:hypothetical protein